MKNLTDDRSDCGGDAPLPASASPARPDCRCVRNAGENCGLVRISRVGRLRYDLSMLRFFLPMMLLFAVFSANVRPVHAIEAFAALLFAADVVTDAGAAAREAAAMTGGRVLDVQTSREGGRQVFHVKVLLDDGRVKIIQLDGASADAPDSNGK